MSRLYRIASYGDDFYTGRIASGQLVLMGLLCPYLILVYFDSEGHYQSYQQLELESPPRIHQFQVYAIYEPEFRASLAQEISLLWHNLSFSHQPIDVAAFQIVNLSVGIESLPEHLAEFLEDPSVAEDDEEADSYRDRISQWEQAGNFVLWWGKD